MLRKALERAGYTVEEAPDGNSAIEKVRSRRYLLVLSDLKLPGSSGFDVLRESRRVEAYASRHSCDGVRLGGRSRHRDEGRRIRFHPEAGGSGSSETAARARGAAAGIAARKFAAARGIRGALRISAHRRRASGDEGSQPDDPARGRDGFDRAAAGRERNGQGTFRARDSSPEPARGSSLRGAELRGDSRRAWSKTSCSATSAAPTPARARARSASSNWRIAARCSSTKSASCRWPFRASCCACSRRSASSASAARRKSK